MKRLLVVGALVGAASTAFAAPGFDVYGGVNIWDQKPSGTFSHHKENSVDMRKDFGFGSDTSAVIYAGFEHFVPLVPNVRLRHMGISDSSTGTLTKNVTFDGQTFTASSDVKGSYDLDMTDLTLYWTPWKTVVKVDLGLTVRHLDAELKIEGGGSQGKESADEYAPLIHVGLSGDLPFSGFYVGGEINGISYSGNRFYDTTFKAGWQSPFLVGVEVGYTQLKLKLDDVSDVDADLEFKGPYLGVNVSF